MVVFVLSGWRGSGKSTVAEYLTKKYDFKERIFAQRLKDLVYDIFDVSQGDLFIPERKDLPLLAYPVTQNMVEQNLPYYTTFTGEKFWTPRSLCIWLAKSIRAVDDTYFITGTLEPNDTTAENVVYSDVRFGLELNAILEQCNLTGTQCVTLRINRMEVASPIEASEHELDEYEFDCYLDNNASIDRLWLEIDKIIELYL